MDQNKKHYCYMLSSLHNNKTYFGYTVNPKRRLRQHNRIIKGGAKRTKLCGPWKMIFLISGFRTQREALQFEFKMNHPSKKGHKVTGMKRGNILDKRVKNLTILLCAEKWTGYSIAVKSFPLEFHHLGYISLRFDETNLDIPDYITEISLQDTCYSNVNDCIDCVDDVFDIVRSQRKKRRSERSRVPRKPRRNTRSKRKINKMMRKAKKVDKLLDISKLNKDGTGARLIAKPKSGSFRKKKFVNDMVVTDNNAKIKLFSQITDIGKS